MKTIAFVLATALVTACAGPDYGLDRDRDRDRRGNNPPVVLNPAPSTSTTTGRTFTYGCEDLSVIVLTEGSNSARATLNSGLEMRLARQPSGAGFRFGGGSSPYEFIGTGADALWHVSGNTFRCRLK